MAKPSILLIPGSFSPPELYDNIIEAVRAKGYEIKGLRLPTVGFKDGPRGTPPTMYDDAAFIAKEAAALADEGKDVMLIAHSYGGIPVTQSTKGLTKGERAKQGKNGGITRLSYMTCLVPPLGSSSANILSTLPDENRIEWGVDDKGWLYITNTSLAALITVSDCPDKAVREGLVEKYQIHSSVSFTNELTHAGYKDVPVSYLFCEGDMCLLPKVQRDGIETIERESGNKVDITYIQAGHSPSFTQPEKVVDWIIRAAERGETV